MLLFFGNGRSAYILIVETKLNIRESGTDDDVKEDDDDEEDEPLIRIDMI